MNFRMSTKLDFMVKHLFSFSVDSNLGFMLAVYPNEE